MVPFIGEAKALGLGVPKRVFVLPTGVATGAKSSILPYRVQVLCLAHTKPLRHTPCPSQEGSINRGPHGGSTVPMDRARGEEDGLPKGKA